MHDTKPYEQILGLQTPWTVQPVAMKKDEGTIEIEVVCTETICGCPICGERMHKHDSTRRRCGIWLRVDLGRSSWLMCRG
jgi:hypothetical protein